MSFALTFTATALLAAPGGSALVFMQVSSPVEPAAKPLLEESLRQAFSARMPVVTCKEAIEDETALKEVLNKRDIRTSADAPKKVGLLADFSKYDCEIPDNADLWAVWLTAYTDSRSGRREVSLRVRNIKDKESRPSFASLAEPEDAHLSWSELVERCVRRYFEEEESSQIQVPPVARVRVRETFALHARLSFASVPEGEAPPELRLNWKLYQCSERGGCDRFRNAVDDYVSCKRSNRARSVSDPSLMPVCLEPLESYDQVAVSMLPDRALPWIHWESDATTPRLRVDIPGEYVLIASARGDLAGAQRLSVEPPSNTLIAFGGVAYRPFEGSLTTDAFVLVSYDRVITQSPVGFIGAGLQWGVRLGVPEGTLAPFGFRGLVAPSILGRHHFTSEWISEAWLAPIGLLYEVNRGTGGYDLHPGTMLGLAIVWHPLRVPSLSVRAGLMGVTQTINFQRSEIYGPLVGAGFAF